MKLTEIGDVQLRAPVRMTLQAWYDGNDVTVMLPRRTLYKYRKEIIEACGVDITISRADQSPSASSALLALDELRDREVTEVPARIQRSLFGAG